MTKTQLQKKFGEVKRENNKLLDEKFDKLLRSGAVELSNWEDDYTLPKLIMCAMGKEMQHQWRPLFDQKKRMKEVDNFYAVM